MKNFRSFCSETYLYIKHYSIIQISSGGKRLIHYSIIYEIVLKKLLNRDEFYFQTNVSFKIFKKSSEENSLESITLNIFGRTLSEHS